MADESNVSTFSWVLIRNSALRAWTESRKKKVNKKWHGRLSHHTDTRNSDETRNDTLGRQNQRIHDDTAKADRIVLNIDWQ